ncbi:prealbumin-like fold domain-containing protein, partial [Zhihengliuella salsuginis]|uniref:prealbumin-like fold domain-containing protein n=1 Tax=Zhihengliuella salsuginis TaxID=578222 RepID=UPI001E62756C
MGLAAGLMFSGSVATAAIQGDQFPAAAEEAATTQAQTEPADGDAPVDEEPAAKTATTTAEEPAEEPAKREAPAAEPAPPVEPVEEPTAEEPAPEPAPKQEPAPEPAPKEEPAPEPAPIPEPAPAPQEKKAEEPAGEEPAVEEEPVEEPEILAVEPFASPSEFQLDWPSDIDMATDPIGNADPTIYDQGSKENNPSSWNFDSSASSPGAGDVGDTWVAAEYVEDDAWLWLAFERTTANGQIGYFLELNQLPPTVNGNGATVPVRTAGDLRLIFPANNDSFSTPQIQTWTGSAWATSSLPAGSWAHVVSQDGTLVEFKFNLSAILGGADGMLECGDFSFSSIMLRSAASASENSELKDFVGGSIDIDLCAGLTIVKTDESGTPLGGATFEIGPNPLPGGTGTLTITDNDANDDDPAAGTINLAEVNPGSYTVTEVGAPDGYLLPADRDQGPQTVEAGGDVTFTFEDPLAWEPLTVEKTIEASYTATYGWDIEKSVDQTRIEQSGTTADFTYLVSVTEGARTTSDFVASGTITVENPNAGPMVATIEDELSDGTACVVDVVDVGAADGQQVQFSAGSTVLDYTCEVAQEPEEASGTNDVSLTWSRADYPQEQSDVDAPESAPQAEATASAGYEWTVTDVDKTITVEDSQFTFDPAWQIEWTAEGTVHEQEYTLTREVPAGECQTFENTATIVETGQSDDAEATLCVGADLVVEKNVIHSFDRTYLWDIEKTALGDQPFEADPETGDVTVEYEVTVGPDTSGSDSGFADSGWAMSGEITVSNPNDWQDIEATVSDAVDIGGGAECTVMDAVRVIAPEGAATFEYTCTFTSEPAYDGENVATAVWDAEAASTPTGEATGTAEVVAGEWSVTPINETVVVEDDHFTFDPEWTITWSEGMEPETRTYELTWNVGEAGTCAEFVNIASVIGEQGLPLAEDDAIAEACREAPLMVDKSIDGSFDRLYLWDVSKDVDRTTVTVGEEDPVPEFGYTVLATPGGVVDSGFELGGTITVENPNSFASGWIVAEVEDTISVEGLVCTVADDDLNADGTVTIAPSSQVVLDYTCTTDGVTAETTGENTAVVTWHDGQRSAMSDPVPVAFDLDAETDRTVDVLDDKTNPEVDPVPLGTAEWNAEG